MDWDRHRYVHFTGMFEQSISPFAATVFPENPLFPPLWVMLLTNEAGGQDKAQRLIDLMRSLNIPAARHGWGSIGSKEGDIPIEAKFPGGGCRYRRYRTRDLFLLSLERRCDNPAPGMCISIAMLVFSTADMLAPIEHILQRYDPGCSIQAEPLKIPYVWFRELTGVVYRPIISCDSSVVHRPLNVAFADDLASELDSVFKPVIEAATDTNVEAAPLNVTGTKSCLRGDRSYYDPEFNTLTLMEDELAELLRKEAAVVEEVGEDLIRLKIDLLGRTTL